MLSLLPISISLLLGQVVPNPTPPQSLSENARWKACVLSGGTNCFGGVASECSAPGRCLNVGASEITGTIPAADLAKLTGLVSLTLNFNLELSGTLPREIGLLTDLTSLFLDTCGFTGSLPHEIGNLTKLINFIAGGNSGLTGSLPRELGKLTALQILRLSESGYTGLLPRELGEMTQLTTLVLNDNSFSGAEDGVCAVMNNPWGLEGECIFSANEMWTDGDTCPTCLNNGGSYYRCRPPVTCTRTPCAANDPSCSFALHEIADSTKCDELTVHNNGTACFRAWWGNEAHRSTFSDFSAGPCPGNFTPHLIANRTVDVCGKGDAATCLTRAYAL